MQYTKGWPIIANKFVMWHDKHAEYFQHDRSTGWGLHATLSMNLYFIHGLSGIEFSDEPSLV